MLHFIYAAGDLSTVADNLLNLLGKIGALLLVVFVGFKALGHIAQDQFGKAIGLIAIALIPALFLFAPTAAEALLRNTINALTGGG
jgi:hypothetical protein